MKFSFKKSDEELQIVWAELYIPEVPDSEHDFMTREEIMKMSYSWMAKGITRCVDIEHNCENTDSVVVESFIARKNDPDFIEGSWVCGIHIPDKKLWESVKKGEYNGFSMYGWAKRGEEYEIEVPSEVVGVTKAENGHTHNFSVAYGPKGEFIGGTTDDAAGHYHVIRRGTVTEEANGHAHKFDFVRGIVDYADEPEEDEEG